MAQTKIVEVTVSVQHNTKRYEVYKASVSRITGNTQWNFKGAYWSLEAAQKAQAKIK